MIRSLSEELAPRSRSFARALLANGPSPELGDRAQDLDWLVGVWRATVRDYDDDGTYVESDGEWWFSWVLEGRALQDVWIVPSRLRREGARKVHNRYGTTIRFLDAGASQWRITWINPVTGKRNELAGRRKEGSFVLEGLDDETPIRWSFNDITPNACTWRGEHQTLDGRWHLGAEFILTRVQKEDS